MSNRANSAIISVLGVLLIVAGIVVGMLAVSGTIDRAIKNEFLPAFSGYILGIGIAIVLVVLGIILIVLGAHYT